MYDSSSKKPVLVKHYINRYVYRDSTPPCCFLALTKKAGFTNYEGNLRYEYNLSDHPPVVGEALVHSLGKLIQRDYYPFGLRFRSVVTGPENSYTYNGKEWEEAFGLNWYHYGARFYDPAVARWWVIDAKDQFISPYVYASNSPIVLLDPDGNDAEIANYWLFSIRPSIFGETIRPWGIYLISKETKFPATINFNSTTYKTKLNSFIDEWQYIAPQVANHLDNNTINVGIAQNLKALSEFDQKRGIIEYENNLGVTMGVGSFNIALDQRLFENQKSLGITLESAFFHELVHTMGYNEFGAFSAQFAAGLMSFETISNFDSSYWLNGIENHMGRFKDYIQPLKDSSSYKIIDMKGFKQEFQKLGSEINYGENDKDN